MKKKYHLRFVRRLRRVLRLLVKGSAYQHNPLLINSPAAFNFRRPLEFPSQLLGRYHELAQ